MRSLFHSLLVVSLLLAGTAMPGAGLLGGTPSPIANGDINGDGRRNLTDAIALLGWLFLGDAPPVSEGCAAGAPDRPNGDLDGDGRRNLSDAIFLLSWLFLSGDEEPAAILCSGGPPAVRFAVLGCTGEGNAAQEQVAEAIRRKRAASGCDFVVLLGNNIYASGVDSVDDPQWQTKFEIPYRNLDLPFYAILGNHDYGGNGAGYEFGKGDIQVQYSARSTRWRMPDNFYRFTEGPAEFFALDTNLQMYGRDAEQRAKVPGWIAASTATWKIALGHHCYLSNGPHGNAGRYEGVPGIPGVSGVEVKSFFDDVICGRVDLHLSAHDLSLQWLEPTCQGTQLLVSGAGSKTTDLPGSNPSRFQLAREGFLYIAIEGKTLTAEFIDSLGEVRFTRSITKS